MPDVGRNLHISMKEGRGRRKETKKGGMKRGARTSKEIGGMKVHARSQISINADTRTMRGTDRCISMTQSLPYCTVCLTVHGPVLSGPIEHNLDAYRYSPLNLSGHDFHIWNSTLWDPRVVLL